MMLKMLIKRSLLKIASIFNYLGNTIYPVKVGSPTEQSLRVIPWFRDNGDKTHRLNYDLKESSIVFDLGGFHGQWAADIFCKYASQVFIFEPVENFAQQIMQRFSNNKSIRVFKFGLSDTDKSERLSLSEDGSSIFKREGEEVLIELKQINKFIDEYKITLVDLMKINIEGGEYDLLEFLIKTGAIIKFRNIQVQFHDFIPDAYKRMKNIQIELQKTHSLTYSYEFVWENWVLKS